jgi:hypothetical protein
MKTAIAIALLSFGINSVSAQKIKESDVPSTIKAAFAKQYSDIKNVKWEKEGANYEAGFDLKKAETSLLFDAVGNIIETESEIKISDLPKEVVDYVAKNLSGQKISEASKIIDMKGKVTYEAEVAKKDYVFDSTGKFIK